MIFLGSMRMKSINGKEGAVKYLLNCLSPTGNDSTTKE